VKELSESFSSHNGGGREPVQPQENGPSLNEIFDPGYELNSQNTRKKTKKRKETLPFTGEDNTLLVLSDKKPSANSLIHIHKPTTV